MKFEFHYLWYGAVVLGFVGLFQGWTWVDAWFPMFALAMAQLSRIRSGKPETLLDRSFKSSRVERLAIGSVFVVVLGITGWFVYLKYVWGPANERAGVQEYLDARAKKLESERSK